MDERALEFQKYFNDENKEQAVSYILRLLHDKTIDIVSLYELILAPSLNHIMCEHEDERICIWKEHIKSGIIRTIVECAYPFVMEERKMRGLKSSITAVILCPPEEYHDIGARMAADFFTLCGCDAIFVGSNTPYHDFHHAISMIHPDIIAISVSDYYNLVATKRMIEEIRSVLTKHCQIIVGGCAFQRNRQTAIKIGADDYVESFADIERIVRSGVTE